MVRVVRARKAMRVRCVSPSIVVPLRSATSLVLQRQTVARGGVLFLKLGNILCSPAPSRALVIFDAASTISLPAPARPHRHPDGHTCTYWWSHGVQSHVLTEPDTRVSVQQRAAVRALSESALRASVGRTAYE